MTLKLVTAEEPEPKVETPDAERLRSCLETLDKLRNKLIAGEVKAFIAVAISADHETFQYRAATARTTWLKTFGAISSLQATVLSEAAA